MKFFTTVEYQGEENIGQKVLEKLREYKIVHFTGYEFGDSIHEFYTKLSDNFPRIFNAGEEIESGVPTEHRWTPIKYDPAFPLRYRASNTRHPLHTDMSYVPVTNSITFFYSLASPPFGGATIFLDSSTLMELLVMDANFSLIERLKTIPVCFSKTDRMRFMPIITEDEKGLILNYNYARLDKENTPEAKELVEEFQDFLDNRVVYGGIPFSLKLAVGEAVFFHDERLLHGRNAFFTPDIGGRSLMKGIGILE